MINHRSLFNRRQIIDGNPKDIRSAGGRLMLQPAFIDGESTGNTDRAIFFHKIV